MKISRIMDSMELLCMDSESLSVALVKFLAASVARIVSRSFSNRSVKVGR